MNPFADFFSAAYLINLPERTDRLRRVRTDLARIGWSLGPSGVQLFPAKKFSDRAGFPSAGVRGAFYSHRECLRRTHAENCERVLIFEDDITFSPAITRLAPIIISQLKAAEWDIVYFGHEETGNFPSATSDTALSEFSLQNWHGDILGLHFYAVNERILPRLIGHLDRIASGVEGDQDGGPMPVDGAFNVFRRFNPDVRTLIAVPKLGWQRPSRSDITPQKLDSVRLLRPLVKVLRDLKYLGSHWRER